MNKYMKDRKLKTYKQFESADSLRLKGDYVMYNIALAFPFTIDDVNGGVYFGPESQAHYVIANTYAVFGQMGRIWVDKKVISFWSLDTDNLKNTLSKIEKKFNDEYKNFVNLFTSKKEIEKYLPINFLDGSWSIDLHNSDGGRRDIVDQVDIDEFSDYESYTIGKNLGEFRKGVGVVVPIIDFLEITKGKVNIELDKELYNQHLMSWKDKEKIEVPEGLGSKLKSVKNPLEWEQAKRLSESNDKLKRYDNKLSKGWTPETLKSELEYVVGIVIDDLEEEHEEDWQHIVDNQEMGNCQSIVSGIKYLKIPGMKYHFGEIIVKFPTEEDYEDKIMTHHWCSYKGEILDFSKGTLSGHVEWSDIYVPFDDRDRLSGATRSGFLHRRTAHQRERRTQGAGGQNSR